MFEDFGKKLSVFGQQMVKKTGEVAEIASLKTKTLAKKKKIQDELLALGKAYYEGRIDIARLLHHNATVDSQN